MEPHSLRPEPSTPDREAERLRALRDLELWNTPPEERFDRITRLARQLLHSPLAVVTLVDEHEYWIKSCQGGERVSGPRATSFCGHAIQHDTPLLVPDVRDDARFAESPLVQGPAGIRAYAGVPLTTTDGHRVGTLCVLETEPRRYTPDEVTTLMDLAAIASGELARIEHARLAEQYRAAELETLRALKTAGDADRAKSEFLAVMSHEIRTPMNAIIGLTDVLLTTSLTDHQEDHLETIRSSGESLLTLLDDILDLSKIEADRMQLDHQLFSLIECVEQVVAMLRPRAQAKQLKLRLDLAPDLPERILSDPLRLRQILIHLIGNSIKFTDRGEVSVEVCCGNCDPALGVAGELLFAVRDTGPGIPAHRMDRLFKPFSQADSSINRKFGGSGLGLAICKRLCELMGGNVWVESEPGHGSCFFFTITAIPDQGAVHASPRPPRTAHAPRPAGPSLRVLVVEDNPVNQKVAEALLRHLGHLPDFASSGGEALDALDASPGRHHVMLLDVQMPGIDGCETIRRIRELERLHPDRPRIYAVAVTADAMPDDRDRCLAAGMDDYLSKPVRLADLKSAFQRYLER